MPGGDDRLVIPLQLGRFKDSRGQFLQDRFELWCRDAADALMATNRNGDPIFEAGKAKAELTIKISLQRLLDDAANFSAGVEIKSNLPLVPFIARTTVLTSDEGLIEKIEPEENYLFNPADGQPEIHPASDPRVAQQLEQ